MLTQSYRKPGPTILGWSIVEWLAVGIASFSAWTLGCAQNHPPAAVSAQPEPEYQLLSQREDETVPIEANDLGVPPAAIMKAGRNSLEEERSTGRFPCGLSVVGVEAATQGDEPEHFLRLVSLEHYRDARWIQTMQDLPMVREVTMLGTYGLDQRGSDWRNLLQASLRVDCGLCLMYAEVHETTADAEFVGVLWDAVTEKPLAAYRVPAVLTADERLKYEEKKKYVGLRSDAEGKAMAELRCLVRDTIWDIAALDDAATTTQPNPWKTGMPFLPRDSHTELRIYMKERPHR